MLHPFTQALCANNESSWNLLLILDLCVHSSNSSYLHSRNIALPRQSSAGRSGGSQEGSRSRENREELEPIEPTREPEKVQKKVVQELSEEEMERKTKAIIDEFLHLQDMKVSGEST